MKSFIKILSIPFMIWGFLFLHAQEVQSVKIWEEELILPTYLVDPPEKSPMFFQNDSYQGASRVIYPYPLEDDFTRKKEDRSYRAVYLENEYLKVCVLPEIGGRLFYATDKTNGYEIFYRQNVIKPAYVGMLGAWISGGIEFCVFHHHRATTNMPVDYDLVENENGSVTLWIGETELRHRMKWTFGISLYPGKSYLELDGRLINPTENTNAFLYWANVATHVNDDYQIIFPPSTDFAVFHAKNSFSQWPITQEAYRGNPYYENDIDASWWKNHPGANSFFAHNIQEGFLAGYDHGKQAGTMVVGNHHIVKGAKLWEWGSNSYWDTHVLTDEDGPYAELMSGAYSDNQPDYSWIKPYEYKVFKQYWYPIRETEGALSANLNGLLNLKVQEDGQLMLAANTTMPIENASIRLTKGEKILFETHADISPAMPFTTQVPVEQSGDLKDIQLKLFDTEENLLVSYSPYEKEGGKPLPETVSPPGDPKDIESLEELYLTGLRLRQFYNARIDAVPYFQEALKRDPLDTRCNTQLGIYHKERGSYDLAATFFRKALVRLTNNYTRPRNCEAFYHLGLILQTEGKLEAAYDTLYRAAWDHSFSAPAYFHLAQISSQKGDYEQALVELDRCLINNASHLRALHLKAVLLRKTGKRSEAKEIVSQILEKDRLNFPAWNERSMSDANPVSFSKLDQLLRDNPESYLELSTAYTHAGFWEEASSVLSRAKQSSNPQLANYPTVHYYLGYIADKRGNTAKAKSHFEDGQKQIIDYCFPFRLESISVFQKALAYNSEDAKAHYYLGNLLFDKQPEKAMEHWENAIEKDPTLSMAHRNMGWGNFYTKNDLSKAIQAYEQAIAVDKGNARFFEELDQLYEQDGRDIQKRYALLTQNHETVAQHSSALVREALVSIPAGDYDRAIDILSNNFFNRREGRSGLHDIYVDALLLRGISHLQEQEWNSAQKDFEAADQYPENHSMGREEDSERRAQIFYLMGQVAEKRGNKRKATNWYEKATGVEIDHSEYKYQQARAFQKLGQDIQAEKIWLALAEEGEALLEAEEEVDFFSKFGGEETERMRKAQANYLIGLSRLGKGEKEEAQSYFKEVLQWDPGHPWVRTMLEESL